MKDEYYTYKERKTLNVFKVFFWSAAVFFLVLALIVEFLK